MLSTALSHINNCCPTCQGALVVDHAKQLAQCPTCHPYGQNALALLMQSGMTFIQAERWMENRQGVLRQMHQGNPTAQTCVVGIFSKL